MRYSDFVEILRNNTDEKISDTKIAQILGFSSQAMHNRKLRNSLVNDSEMALIAKCLGIDPLIFKKLNEEYTEEIINLKKFSEVTASLGLGQEVINETEIELVPVTRSFLRKIGACKESSSIINTKGDSMYPTIMDGDKLLVDTSKKNIIDSKIYIIRIDNAICAKRLQKLPKNSIKIISDNQVYESYSININNNNINFDIIGRVMWLSRNL